MSQQFHPLINESGILFRSEIVVRGTDNAHEREENIAEYKRIEKFEGVNKRIS